MNESDIEVQAGRQEIALAQLEKGCRLSSGRQAGPPVLTDAVKRKEPAPPRGDIHIEP